VTGSDFDRDLGAWLDGELPAERSAEIAAAVESSPDLARRVELERAFGRRVRRALVADAGDARVVRRMLDRARATKRPAGRLFGLPRVAVRAVAASILVAWVGLWWLCVPPFECSYLQALERSSRDASATPGPSADADARRLGLPDEIDGAKAAPPAVTTQLDFHAWHRRMTWSIPGVRLDYVRPDATAFHVVACDSADVRPSMRRRVHRDGLTWWRADTAGACEWVFDRSETNTLYAVVGPERDDEALYAAARALRASIH
jgi:hypothetical protein